MGEWVMAAKVSLILRRRVVLIEILTDISDELLHLSIGSDTNKQLELGIGSAQP
jgi:hypothetical protein